MTAQPPWAMPTPWNNQDIVLYHGTLDHHAQDILSNGVSLAGANPDADFGPGFYTTTLRRQAEAWAFVKVAEATADGKSHSPGLVEFTASRDSLAALDCLWFVRDEFDAVDFWSLVFHCRTGHPDHRRPPGTGLYDTVVGPMAAFWRQRVALQGYDQISFHTPNAITFLNADPKRWKRIR